MSVWFTFPIVRAMVKAQNLANVAKHIYIYMRKLLTKFMPTLIIILLHDLEQNILMQIFCLCMKTGH